MNGFIVKKIDKIHSYRGIDATDFHKNHWTNLEEWNKLNKEDKIELSEDNIIYKGDNLNGLLKYILWENSHKKNELNLFYFNTSISGKIKDIDSFLFMGYDCVYLENEYSESILFSPIYNELKNPENILIFSDYINQINKNGLFNDSQSASSYIKFRKSLFDQNKGNLERAWEKIDVLAVKVSLFIT